MRNPLQDIDIYCLTSEEHSLGRSNVEIVRAMLDAGVRLVQYREKHKPAAARLRECETIREITARARVLFLVNDDVAVARLVDADGVHVGQDDLPVAAARRLLGPGKIVGLSAQNPAQTLAAVQAGADYIGAGPIYPTQTKPDAGAASGLEFLEWIVANLEIPFVVIGGIKEHNVAEVVRRGARCVAVITEIVGKPDIAGQIRALRRAMREAGQ